MNTVVISQSMYFPWVGMLEQIRLANVFIHFDDVQFARGFINRVQIKTREGMKWITVPLRDRHQSQHIDEILIDDRLDWRSQHLGILRQAYKNAPYRDEMLNLVNDIFSNDYTTIAELSRQSMISLAKYFGITKSVRFVNASELNVKGKSSKRLHDLCRAVNADVYLTGHGAKNYLDHSLFEESRILVKYMKYKMSEYPQLHGEFTPYVTGLDLVANCGHEMTHIISSESEPWYLFKSNIRDTK